MTDVPDAIDANTRPGRGLLLVISGPSGVGKTTVTRGAEAAVPGADFSVSVTTRPRTAADRDGVDYTFVSDAEFDRLIAEDALLEHADVFGKRYGTPRSEVESRLAAGHVVILEIDVEGARQIKQRAPGALCVFIMPPSEDTLLQRLRDRKREDEAAIQRRFAEARREIETARACGAYDAFVVNDDLEQTIGRVVDLVAQRRGHA